MRLLLWKPSSVGSDQGSPRALIKLEAREARLLGLDMPTKIEATGKDGAPLTIAVARQIIGTHVVRQKMKGSEHLNPKTF